MAMDLTRLHFGTDGRSVSPRGAGRVMFAAKGEMWWYNAEGPDVESASRAWLDGADIDAIRRIEGVTLEWGCP